MKRYSDKDYKDISKKSDRSVEELYLAEKGSKAAILPILLMIYTVVMVMLELFIPKLDSSIAYLIVSMLFYIILWIVIFSYKNRVGLKYLIIMFVAVHYLPQFIIYTIATFIPNETFLTILGLIRLIPLYILFKEYQNLSY